METEYNSQRENLVIAEYGRHVQKLIEHAKTIEDRDMRQRFTEGVIYLMYQMNPSAKNIKEVEEKLWKHAFRISGYELDVTPPDGIVLCKAEIQSKPEKVDYPHVVRKNRHYGGYIQEMIVRAMEIEDKVAQKEFLELIGSYMKLAYKTWNRDHYANDEMIRGDLNELTGEKIDYINELRLNLLSSTTNSHHLKPQKSTSRKGGIKKKPIKKRFRKRK